MADATHATVTTLHRDLSKQAKQEESFREMFERGFDVIPGFVSGIWTFDREASEVIIVHSFDSLRAAEDFAEMARGRTERQAVSFSYRTLSRATTQICRRRLHTNSGMPSCWGICGTTPTQ